MATTHSDGDRISLSRNDVKILTALLTGPLNGYQIASQCQADEQMGARISNGALRPALIHLGQMSFISSLPNGNYKITPVGHQVLAWEIDRLSKLTRLAKARMKHNPLT